MNCYCYETEYEYVLCVEDADLKFEDNLQAAWFKKTVRGFIKSYPKEWMATASKWKTKNL